VLDIGAFASEIPLILRTLGYARVSALDLNPAVTEMPFSGAIDYRVGDFLRAPYADGFFGAITAISVIEHGFDGDALVSEVRRLLRPGGYFVALRLLAGKDSNRRHQDVRYELDNLFARRC
jgi:SAM-dependent methyltransferase